MGMQQSIRLTAIEESILLWEQASVPWNNQIDVSAPRLDPDRLRHAFNVAFAHHELASCSVQPDGRGRHIWRPPTTPVDVGPIDVVVCGGDDAVDALRRTQLDTPIPLDHAPLLRVVVARRPHDDLVLSSANHLLCDGLGLLRLYRSVGRAYTGTPDPPPARSIATAQRALVRRAPSDLQTLTRRWATAMGLAATSVSPRARVAPRGGGSPGYGTTTRTIAIEHLDETRARHGASVDELLMAAMHLTLDRWNTSVRPPVGTLGVSLSVSLRDDAWADDVVINLCTFASVLSGPAHRVNLDTALDAIRGQVARQERLERARLAAEAARASGLIPASIRVRALDGAEADRFDSCTLSNLGVVHDPPRFEVDHRPEIWISPPAVPEVGLGLAVYTVGDSLQVNLRYRRERFDADAAAALTDDFVATLLSP